jgi:hypothetical protein
MSRRKRAKASSSNKTAPVEMNYNNSATNKNMLYSPYQGQNNSDSVYMDGSRITSNAFVAGSTGVDAEKHRDDDMMMNPSYNKTMSTATVAETMEVVFNYVPNLSDEIFLYVGDPVIVKMKFDDGWGYGFNMTTKMEGSFPLACVAPFDREGGAAHAPSGSERGDEWIDGSGASISRNSFSIRKRVSSMYASDFGNGYRNSEYSNN